jgi:hypothetical protein
LPQRGLELPRRLAVDHGESLCLGCVAVYSHGTNSSRGESRARVFQIRAGVRGWTLPRREERGRGVAVASWCVRVRTTEVGDGADRWARRVSDTEE